MQRYLKINWIKLIRHHLIGDFTPYLMLDKAAVITDKLMQKNLNNLVYFFNLGKNVWG